MSKKSKQSAKRSANLTREELAALRQTLEYLRDEEGKSHQGYFYHGWAGSILRDLYEKSADKPKTQKFS